MDRICLSWLRGDCKGPFGWIKLKYIVHLALQYLQKTAQKTKRPKFGCLKTFEFLTNFDETKRFVILSKQ